ncbi:hypothetical protein PENTCL1PPCAC_22893, partial [Pristionchus entomophagus]
PSFKFQFGFVMSDAESSDHEKFIDGDWMIDELSADESDKPATSNADPTRSVLHTTYLSTANGTSDLVRMKKHYVDNMKRLIRTCRKEVETLKSEKDTALRRLAERDAVRIKPMRAKKGNMENSIVLCFKNHTEMQAWILLQRIQVEGRDVSGDRGEENGMRRDQKENKSDRSNDAREDVRIVKMETKEMDTQTSCDQGEKAGTHRQEKNRWDQKEISDGEIDDGLINDGGSRSGKRRRTRSPSREEKRRREDDYRFRKIEEARRREGELRRKLEIQQDKSRRGSDGRKRDDRINMHRRHL